MTSTMKKYTDARVRLSTVLKHRASENVGVTDTFRTVSLFSWKMNAGGRHTNVLARVSQRVHTSLIFSKLMQKNCQESLTAVTLKSTVVYLKNIRHTLGNARKQILVISHLQKLSLVVDCPVFPTGKRRTSYF